MVHDGPYTKATVTRSLILRVAAATLGLALLVSSVGAADTEPEATS
jgi:hypothetical protein